MDDSKFEFDKNDFIISTILIVLLAIALGGLIGYASTASHYQKRAVAHGAAEYVSCEGDIYWRWK